MLVRCVGTILFLVFMYVLGLSVYSIIKTDQDNSAKLNSIMCMYGSSCSDASI